MQEFRGWFFSVGTRVVELLSAIALIGYVIMIAVVGKELANLVSYSSFKMLTNPVWLVALLALAFVQLFFVVKPKLQGCVLGGILLLLSAFVWAFITALYSTAETLTPSLALSLAIAFFCAFAGYEVITQSRTD